MALLTYEFKGLGQTGDRRESIMTATQSGDPRWAAINNAVAQQYGAAAVAAESAATSPFSTMTPGGSPWLKWALIGLGSVAVVGAVVLVVRRRRKAS